MMAAKRMGDGKKDDECFRVYFKGQKKTFGLLAVL